MVIGIMKRIREFFNRNFNLCGREAIAHILLMTQQVVEEFLRNIFEESDVSLATNHSILGADPYHDPDPGILKRNIYHCGIGAVVRILRHQLPYWRFAVSECFWFN